jgi:hypothetical protein
MNQIDNPMIANGDVSKTLIIKKKKQLHFVVENLSINKKDDCIKIEKIFLLKIKVLNINDSKINIGKLKNYVKGK